MQGHKYSHFCNLCGKFLPAGMICTTTDAISIPVGAMYVRARMFCALAHTSSIPMGARNFYMQERFFTLADTTFIHMCVKYLHAGMFCTLAHTSSIPMGAINFYMQERFLHSLMQLLYPWVYVFTCRSVLYTRSYVFYSHGCNKFQHARMFFTLTDTTFIPMGVMYLHARMFCTLAHTYSIPMGAINFYMLECFLHSLIRLLYPCV